MFYERPQLVDAIISALMIIAIHSPTVAMLNYIIWGYILPKYLKRKLAQSYA